MIKSFFIFSTFSTGCFQLATVEDALRDIPNLPNLHSFTLNFSNSLFERMIERSCKRLAELIKEQGEVF